MSTLTLDAQPWRDTKRYLWPLGAVALGLPYYGWLLFQATGWSVFCWSALLFVYGAIPLMDVLIGTDETNPPESRVPTLMKERYYRWAVYVSVPVEYAVFVWGIYTAVTVPLAWHETLGLVLSVGGVLGLSINIAHELGHSTDPFERWLAKIALAPVAYGHFFTEHNRGHHVRVATPEDPASSRFGENFYAFLPRSVFGSLASAWEIERSRLARNGRSVWSLDNQNLQAWSMTLAIWIVMTAWLGWTALGLMIVAAVYGFSLLEVVNYLEHYGLKREKRADGSYERCQPHHSWNSNHVVTNVLLYHLQRHSDHHANPTRSYQALRNFDAVPQLPSGYSSMILLAYVPPLWRRVMDPRVVAHFKGDMSRANIHPPLREAVLAQYRSRTA